MKEHKQEIIFNTDLKYIPSCQAIYAASIENSINVVLEITPYKKHILN